MANISKELYDNLGKLLRFFRQPFPPGGPGGRRGAENNAQTRVLQFLSASGAAKTTGEIAEKLEIRQQSASELVSKLEKKALVEKTKDAKDKRVINADAKLKPVFGKDQVNMFELAGIVGKHVS